MKLSHAYSRVAVRPFPSEKWVYSLLVEVKKRILRIFMSIKEVYKKGEIPYDEVKLLGEKSPVWYGVIPEGKYKGLDLAIYLIPGFNENVRGRLTTMNPGKGTPISKISLFFAPPEFVSDIDDFCYDDIIITEVMQTLHHELVHFQDPKHWKDFQRGRKHPSALSIGLDKYYRLPKEVSAIEGSSYQFFVDAKERGLPLKEAIQDYFVIGNASGYAKSIRGDKKRWRDFLTRLYKSADQAYNDSN